MLNDKNGDLARAMGESRTEGLTRNLERRVAQLENAMSAMIAVMKREGIMPDE